MDLIGIPIRITIGNSFREGKVELKLRDEEKLNYLDKTEVVDEITSIIKSKI